MKKFKKSSVIVPALARIAVTATASVSGTVAWFTANRAVSASLNSFTAYDENGSLTITATNIQGTNVDGTTVTPTGLLTDASFDLTDVWTDVPSDVTSAQPTTFKKVSKTDYKTGNSAKIDDKTTKDVYYAVSWKYTITFTAKSTTNVNLFFDLSSAFSGVKDNDTSHGFRIAMVADQEENPENIVWGVDDTKTHVSEVKGATTTTATFDTYVQTNPGYTKKSDGAAIDNVDEYLGTFTSTKTAINVTCTAWYEGTDAAVVSRKSMSTLGATMKFYARNASK